MFLVMSLAFNGSAISLTPETLLKLTLKMYLDQIHPDL